MSTIARGETVRRTSSLAAFSSPAFRLYFAGQLVSVSGTWMQSVAQQVVVYNLTKSDIALGVVACAQGLPSLFLTPFAGVIVERFSRRNILIATQTAMMILAFILAVLQFANVLQVWHIMALSLGLGIANALDAPARQAFVVEMVGHEQLSSGIVLNAIMFNGARIIGPALAGFALAQIGPAWCFFLNGASFLAVIAGLFLMHVTTIIHLQGRVSIWKPLLEGIQFARTHLSIRPLLLLSAIDSVFGLTFVVLMPAFADEVFKDTTGGYTAALLTAQGVGAVLAGLATAQANTRGRRGQLLVVSAIAAPVCIVLFSFNSSFIPALILAAFAGFFMTCQFVLMNTLIQAVVPDEFRGRVMSLYTLTFFGLNPFSSLAIGVIAEAVSSTPFAILTYGVLCLVFSAIILYRYQTLGRLT